MKKQVSLILLGVVLIFSNSRSSLKAQNTVNAFAKSSAAPIYYSAENLRSDTFNILEYAIHLEVGNTSSQNLQGYTAIRLAPKMNNRTFIRFDLLKLQVDSVKENGSSVSFTVS